MVRFLLIAVVMLSVAGCATSEAQHTQDPGAPPTEDELRWLGPDAYNDFFLTRWRKCVRYASENVCFSEFYGGDGSGLD
ncbi:MAG: hypothetical protein H6905_05835 [Hyphomicrobiales bacterium]|nr:hypothetical protein [Hyphomicrobiales bacterium]